jgi:tetratricopeptide (TPR) repeat protein
MRSFLRAAIGLGGVLAMGVFMPVAQAAQSSPSAGSDGPAYYFMLGKQLESAGQNEQALAAFTRAIELDPESAELRAELAGYYARQNNAVDAVRVAEEALKRDPANPEANRIIGTVYASLAEQRIVMRRGDDLSTYPARAIAALEKAKGDGSDLGLNLLLGRLYLQSGAFDKAVPLLKIVVEARPEMVDAAILLSNAQQGAGQEDDAIQTIKGVLAENPESFRAQLRLAELYEAAEQWTEAAETYAKAQAMNAGRAASLTPRRAVALLSAGRAADAKALVESAINTSRGSDGADPILLYLLAESQRQLKNLDAARATAEKLVAAHPDDARGLHVLSLILQDQGDVKGAERALRDLISRDPIDANALNSLGYLLAERGDRLDEAVTLVERALKIEPDNPSYLDSLGWAYFQQGRLDLADAKLTEAASRLKSSSVVQDHLGDLRFKQQRYRDAAAAWEQALAGDGQSIDRSKIERKLREARGRM